MFVTTGGWESIVVIVVEQRFFTITPWESLSSNEHVWVRDVWGFVWVRGGKCLVSDAEASNNRKERVVFV
jgi:hypothetical protein